MTALHRSNPSGPSRPDLAPATSFAALKAKISSSNDPTSSGSQDRPLVDLLRLINTSPDHVTTSSCSGRVVIYAPCDDDAAGVEAEVFDDGESDEEEDVQGKGKARSRTQNGKGGGSWLFVSHEEVAVPSEEHEVMKLLFGNALLIPYEDEAPLTDDETFEDHLHDRDLGGVVSFKFESMVLHITSSSPTTSLPLLHAALRTGHADSGLLPPSSALPSLSHPIPTPTTSEALSARRRSNLAIRSSSMNLDCPIAVRVAVPAPWGSPASWVGRRGSRGGTRGGGEPMERPTMAAFRMLVPPSYLSYLLRQANLRMRSNEVRIGRLEKAFEEVLLGVGVEGRSDRVKRESLRGVGVDGVGDWLQGVEIGRE